MRTLRLFCTGLVLILCLSYASAVLGQADFTIPRAREMGKEYLPGDFVHVIVEAPLDTVQINVVMPDSKILSMVQDRGTNIWHGLWQVPVKFKSGRYTANINAVDVEGEVFSGQTDTFVVGRLALISLTRKSTLEAVKEKPFAQVITKEKKIVTPATPPSSALRSRAKAKLVEQNLIAGKSRIAEGKFSEAQAYLRVALYLAPENKEASGYLIKTEEKIKEQKQQSARFTRRLFLLLFLALLILAVIAYFIIRCFGLKIPVKPAALDEKPIPFAEKQKLWCEKVGCEKYPFFPEALKDIFIGNKHLELESLKQFVGSHIERFGGKAKAVFTDAALDEIYKLSKGKVKLVFQICDWAAKRAIQKNADIITAEIVNEYAPIAFKKILIVDDDEIVLSTLDKILKKGGGYETDLAMDGEEALQKIKENVYGLVLLDIVIPKIDGYEVLKRARETQPELPIVFISGRGEAKKIMESLSKYHLTALIEKPFTLEKVLDQVAESLKIMKS